MRVHLLLRRFSSTDHPYHHIIARVSSGDDAAHLDRMENSAMLLPNKVAIVTGGNSGIGRAIALELAREGAAVAINYLRDPAAAEALTQAIGQGGGRAIAIQGDVSRLDDIQRLIGQTVQAFGRLDVMVNNAGIET